MNMEKELISVVIPVYNVSEYLQKCITSVCRQSYRNIEIVLVDDGSTDGSSDICDKASEGDSRIRVIHQENGGRSVARNRGIREARGEYLLFVDGDDWIDDNCIEVLYGACKEYQATLAVGRYRSVYKDKVLDESTNEYLVLEGQEPLEFYINGYRNYQNVNSVCVKLYRRELLKDIRFEEGKYYEDIMFTTLVYEMCKKCVYIDTAVYNYNIGTPTSITFSGVNVLTFRDEIPTFNKKELFLKNIGRADLAETYAFFKYQRLLTYYRDCRRIGTLEDKDNAQKIREIIYKEREKVLLLCRQEKGSKLERLELRLFLIHGNLYLLFYHMLGIYGRIKKE